MALYLERATLSSSAIYGEGEGGIDFLFGKSMHIYVALSTSVCDSVCSIPVDVFILLFCFKLILDQRSFGLRKL